MGTSRNVNKNVCRERSSLCFLPCKKARGVLLCVMQDEILAVRDGFRGSWMGIGWKGVVWEFMYVGVWGVQDGMRSLNKKGLVCVSVTGVTRRERSWVQQQAVVGGDSRGQQREGEGARERENERMRGREMARCSKGGREGGREQRANSSSSFKKRGGPAASRAEQQQQQHQQQLEQAVNITLCTLHVPPRIHIHVSYGGRKGRPRVSAWRCVEVRGCRHRARSGLCWEMSRAIAPYSGSSFVLLRVYVLQVICYKLYKLSRGAAADHSATCILYTF